MSVVPLAAAAVFAGADEQLRAAFAGAAVRVGDRVEVEVGQLPDEPAADLGSWWRACEDLWAAAATGADLTGRRWVRTRRRLLDVRQSTAKGAKADLVEEYTALLALPSVTDLVTEATSVSPVAAQLRSMAAAHGGAYTRATDGSAATLTVTLAGDLLIPAALGGCAYPGEIARLVTLDLRYAAWRDRRVRRLARVSVDVDELWAAPPGR